MYDGARGVCLRVERVDVFRGFHDDVLARSVTRMSFERTNAQIARSRAVLTAAGGAVFCLLAVSVAGADTSMEAPTGHRWWIDRYAIYYRIRHDILADHPPRLRLSPLVSLLSPAALVSLSCLGLAYTWWRGERPGSAAFAAALIAAPLASALIKPLVGRQVPSAISGTDLTFPSGHLAILGAFLTALFLVTEGLGIAFRVATAICFLSIAVLFSVLFALTGNHFVTDCIGGLLFGASLTSTVEFVARCLIRRSTHRRQAPEAIV